MVLSVKLVPVYVLEKYCCTTEKANVEPAVNRQPGFRQGLVEQSAGKSKTTKTQTKTKTETERHRQTGQQVDR